MNRPTLSRKQIEDHKLINPEYKKMMLEQWDEYEQELNKRVRIGMYIIFAFIAGLAICLSLSGCSDKDARFKESQAVLQWKLDSLEKARQNDGFNDEADQNHEREYNSAENQKIIIHHSK